MSSPAAASRPATTGFVSSGSHAQTNASWLAESEVIIRLDFRSACRFGQQGQYGSVGAYGAAQSRLIGIEEAHADNCRGFKHRANCAARVAFFDPLDQSAGNAGSFGQLSC